MASMTASRTHLRSWTRRRKRLPTSRMRNSCSQRPDLRLEASSDDESEVEEIFLARTWSENKALKLARRKGHASSQPTQDVGGRAAHQCRRCDKVGHWEEDCTEPKNPPN